MNEELTISEQVTVEKTVTVVAVKAFQWVIDGTDAIREGGVTTIKGYLISSEGEVVGERSYTFSGAYYISQISELTNPQLSHREDFISTTDRVLTEIATNQELKDSLIASGELEIDVPVYIEHGDRQRRRQA